MGGGHEHALTARECTSRYGDGAIDYSDFCQRIMFDRQGMEALAGKINRRFSELRYSWGWLMFLLFLLLLLLLLLLLFVTSNCAFRNDVNPRRMQEREQQRVLERTIG